MLRMKTRTKSSGKLKAAIRAARNAHKGGVHSVQAGFFSGSVNEQGQPITNIAANNEFGARRDDGVRIPERPFMRRANASMGKAVLEVIKDGIDPLTGQIDGATAAKVGATMVNHIQSSILYRLTTLRTRQSQRRARAGASCRLWIRARCMKR